MFLATLEQERRTIHCTDLCEMNFTDVPTYIASNSVFTLSEDQPPEPF